MKKLTKKEIAKRMEGITFADALAYFASKRPDLEDEPQQLDLYCRMNGKVIGKIKRVVRYVGSSKCVLIAGKKVPVVKEGKHHYVDVTKKPVGLEEGSV